MKKDEYRKEVSSIVTSDEWKSNMKKQLKNPPIKKRPTFQLKYVSLILVSCCLMIMFVLNQQGGNKPTIPPNDPKVDEPNTKDPVGGDGMGFSGIMVKDPKELEHNSAYKFTSPSKTMPIYKNLYLTDTAGAPINPKSTKEKKAILEKYAKDFQLSNYSIYASDVYPTLDAKDMKLQLLDENRLMIEFSDDYIKKNTVNMDVSTKQEAENLVKELYNKYKSSLKIQNPIIDVSYGYSYFGEKQWSFGLSEETKNQNHDLINQQTNNINFYCNEDKIFNSIGISFEDLKVEEEVPIISLEEAKKRFQNNQFLTNVFDFQRGDIGYIELCYYTSANTKYYLPYYLFYSYYEEEWKDINAEKNNLKTYAMCYVSALSDEMMEKYNIPKTLPFN